MKRLIIYVLLVISYGSVAQETGEIIEQQETADHSDTEWEMEDDGYLEQLENFRSNPVDINSVTAEFLEKSFRLNAIQAEQFIRYRTLLGPFIDLMELQAVPGWEPGLIRQLLPYITLQPVNELKGELLHSLSKGNHQLLLRTGRVLEKQAGFQKKDGEDPKYAGSPLRVLLKYSFKYKKQLQWGITAEKDAGEPFMRLNNKAGFDFYSFHLMYRRPGAVHTLIAGDFIVNMGQGLIHWQGNAFKKSTGDISSLRQGQGINPYRGVNENLYHRGLGILAGRGKKELLLFAAWNKQDASLVADAVSGSLIRSWPQSGLHRTSGEMQDEDAARMLAAGFRSAFKSARFRAAWNAIGYWFDFPVQKKQVPENLYEISGKRWLNTSVDFRFHLKNHLFFGEIAFDQRKSWALVTGILSSLHEKLDLSVLYRNISPAYRSIQGNAFTVSRDPENENGFYTGLHYRWNPRIAVSGYLDFYRFPWLKFRYDGPSQGLASAIQFRWKPDKRQEFALRYTLRSETAWLIEENSLLKWPAQITQYHFSFQSSIQPSRAAIIRTRLDIKQIRSVSGISEKGYMCFAELIHKKPFSKVSFSLRMALFSTDSYRSGIGAFERDVLYNSSVQILYNSGMRYYVLLHYKMGKYVQAWVKWMQTHYIDKQEVGSGDELISGPRKSEFRLQLLINF